MKQNNPIIGAIIQTRMTSTRLPGKVLENIAGKAMVWHVINRLSFSKKIDDIILAIPTTKESNVLEDFARDHNLKCFRGSEEDVLLRFYGAAKEFGCDVIVRVTSDCPLIDPEIVDLIIEKYQKVDYASNTLERSFPRGLDAEVFSFSVLEKAHKEAKEYYQREHVTPYIYEHPEIFKLYSVKAEGKLKRPDLRLTVDTKEDLELVREIYKHLYNPQKIFLTKEVIDLFERNPELSEINNNIKQKSLKE